MHKYMNSRAVTAGGLLWQIDNSGGQGDGGVGGG